MAEEAIRVGLIGAGGRRGLALPLPLVVADSWFGDSKLMQHIAHMHEGTLLIEGKQSYVFTLADGCQLKGQALIQGEAWPWRQHSWEPRVRYARLRVTSPTYGQDCGECGRTGPGALLSAVSGDEAERTAVDPSVAAAPLD
jgi:hypothetical protein